MALFENPIEPDPSEPIEAELDALAAPDRTEPLLPKEPAHDSAEPMIAFDDVSISFNGHKVLENVSFSVNRGETLCILGRSGVGKSVSLRLLMGFLKPDSGTIRVGGEDITQFTEKQLQEVRRKVTMVFQNGALFDSISVGENVAFPLRERGDME